MEGKFISNDAESGEQRSTKGRNRNMSTYDIRKNIEQ
jgi:hypothetical protein